MVEIREVLTNNPQYATRIVYNCFVDVKYCLIYVNMLDTVFKPNDNRKPVLLIRFTLVLDAGIVYILLIIQ